MRKGSLAANVLLKGCLGIAMDSKMARDSGQPSQQLLSCS